MTPHPADPSPIRIGTRSSPMALGQAEQVVTLLTAAHPQHTVTVVPMTAHGDRHTGPLAAIGGKGAWVRELDAALDSGRIDASVSCAITASVHAHHHDGQLTVHAAVYADDGHRTLRMSHTGPRQQPELLGTQAGRELLAMGARNLLNLAERPRG